MEATGTYPLPGSQPVQPQVVSAISIPPPARHDINGVLPTYPTQPLPCTSNANP
ncbi:hypothetical protein BO70DRAFT_162652 [Aspergillus heteromorphus CBS 117.55]|uniref:Uncharacterized protein n=1 Tax=Aspergillus heteromorphus CBS 117.55 TaxID=1448321 RepID=A0A317WRV3_9EURO|nr:uncharacterized protein BO70DRAFT_162652 [Aspergillus heteromorphus CBS 117.55]PWY89184.1 hypothetical protein BO70DRAFT_162652 [Aspergillus heteromorphus CBS 117.55]